MKNKFAIFLLVIVLLAIGILVFLIIREKELISEIKVSNNLNNIEKAQEKNTEELADSELVTIDILEGRVTQVTDKFIIINNGGKEETYNLVNKERLGVFKQKGENIEQFYLDKIGVGDSVSLEVRKSDNLANVIIVK